MKQQILKPVSSVIFLLLVLGMQTGCIHQNSNDSATVPLELIVHGPLVLALDEKNRVWIVVPKDDHRVHQLIPGDPTALPLSEAGPCEVTYQFALTGVESSV